MPGPGTLEPNPSALTSSGRTDTAPGEPVAPEEPSSSLEESGGAGGTPQEGDQGVGGNEAVGGAGGTAQGSSAAGAAGEGSTEPMDIGNDRCDVAVYDPDNPPQVLDMGGSLGTHDPTVIEQEGTFYLFNTGNGVPGKTSTDLANWSNAPAVFDGNITSWASTEVPEARDLWAPDLSFFNGKYHLYYSASSFGSNDSCMGHATRESMSSGSWQDHGPIFCSESSDPYNAIDPNIFVNADDKVWFFFGSHWDGIKAIELDATGMSTVGELYDIAARPQAPRAIEAPVVVRRCGYYYLFVSFDQCCNNWDSGVPYNIRVGRSESVLGPYVDREGTQMYPNGS